MYQLITEKNNFKLYKDSSVDNIIQLKIKGELIDKIDENIKNIRINLKNEKKITKIYKKIIEYKFIATENDIDYYYISCESPNPYLIINSFDIILAISVNKNIVTIKSVDNPSMLNNDIYERITKLNIQIKTDNLNKTITCKVCYHPTYILHDFININSIFDFIIDIVDLF